VSAPLRAAAKAGGAKKAKKSTKKDASTQESFKKSEVVAAVAEKTGFTKIDSERALQAVLDTLTEVCIQVLLVTMCSFFSYYLIVLFKRALILFILSPKILIAATDPRKENFFFGIWKFSSQGTGS